MTLLIDAMILAMLAGVLAYAWMVDRRVRFLMETLRELQPMITAYAAAVDKSEESVRDLASATRSLTEAPAAPRAQPAPPAKPAPRTGDKAARAARARAQAAGITRVTGKTELVQGFFDSVRERDQ
ncbi:flagellar motor switch protein [Limimaricola cinnabarinus]